MGYARASPGIFWRLDIPTICLRCCYIMVYVYTSNMFMVLQVVVLWSYMSYKFCAVIYYIE